MWTRRQTLQMFAATALSWPGLSFGASSPSGKKLVLILLRGGLDGLDALRPTADPAWEGLRPGVNAGEPLGERFSLHPAFGPLAGWVAAGDLAAVHAVATPYRVRSHFEVSDVLENGATEPGSLHDGWLNRALSLRPKPPHEPVAFGLSVPLVLRGPAPATSVDGSVPGRLDDAFLSAVEALYADDRLLRPVVEEARKNKEFLEDQAGTAKAPRGEALAKLAGALLAGKAGPDTAVIELGGFDTHSRQEGTLNQRLGDLVKTLAGLKDGLGDRWKDTAIVAVSEFGRTAKANGTAGTDHGTGGVAFLAGGAVAGGDVLGDWPGLGAKALYEGRDLAPANDVRSVFKGVLRDHLGIDEESLAKTVFPASERVLPLNHLIRRG